MSLDPKIFTGKFSVGSDNFQQKCSEILANFKNSDDVLRAARNTLKKITFDGRSCVVKAFRKPSFPQNYSYGLVSDSKAKKSYNNAHKLIKKGFITPAPIGYFESRKAGKLTFSYYICEYAEETETLRSIYKQSNTLSKPLIENFTTFCIELHNQGVLHRDFNPLNILVKDTDAIPSFSLVDINRITWYQNLTLARSMHSLSRLGFPTEISHAIIDEYAKQKGVSNNQCLDLFTQAELKTKRYFDNKKRLRRIFPKK